MEDETRAWDPTHADGMTSMLSPQDWDEIDRLFDAVMDLPERARPAYLDRACLGRPLIRRQIELLLAASDEAEGGDFLAPLPHQLDGSIVRQFAGEEQLRAGDTVGVYEIVRPIGKGGMGVVYLAQRPFGRFKKPVALKVVKRGMDTDDIVQRFRFERQILAGLEHAHIARLLDGGVTDEGLPYFVLEYVEGKPIDQYCDEHCLSVRERLALFKDVCDAVQYAHRNLVVHRDLKPGNVMVTKEGAVKLLDFGIAKVLDPESPGATVPITDASNRRLTPEYAAPEQVRGEAATTATDVYALGMILYELLSGRRPYRFKTRLLTEIEEKICQEVPGRPSTAVLRAEGDETPEEIGRQRGATPDRLRRELSGDLDAITLMALKKEQELRYASAGDLAADIERYLDRRPVQAQRDSVGYRVRKFVQRYRTAVALGAFGVLALLAGAGTTWWQSHQKQLEARRVEEEVRGRNATIGFINTIFDRVDPDRPQGYTFSAMELIQAGLQDIERLSGTPEIQADLLNQIGKVSLNAGLIRLADSLHQAAYDIQRRALGPDHPALSLTLTRLADVLVVEGDDAAAQDLFNRAIAIDPENDVAHNNLGIFLFSIGQVEQGGAHVRQAIAIAPDVVRYRRNLGNYYYYSGRWDLAKETYLETAAADPYYLSFANLATIYFYDENYERSAYWYEQSLALNANDFKIWGYFGTALYWRDGALSDASAEAFQRAWDSGEERLATLQQRDPAVLAQLATFTAMLGRRDAMEAYIAETVAQSTDDPYVWYDLAYAREAAGGRDAAMDFLSRALALGYDEASIADDPTMRALLADPRWANRRDETAF